MLAQTKKMQLIIRGQNTFLIKIAQVQDFGETEFTLSCNGHLLADDTPVEKQEKSKKKTGRANKRRIQYNRRFVTVVPTFGRRRGPNANPGT
ncbi:Similar to Fau: 40S ribosomal protein S30 (Rattus norvegicus) [Cotesia congregata]|uniref:Similar to Fau: 40S ribosomal protein S30 (Rattus norvegicus) n=1 Tax=Cotesia congregata TaxID=51543 RepID=A0A8J2H3G3_COTCN|nr:Similar to Fau: 40S ribosomal protein S30 (Rattus norvegicus) [Cotesia congregata]